MAESTKFMNGFDRPLRLLQRLMSDESNAKNALLSGKFRFGSIVKKA